MSSKTTKFSGISGLVSGVFGLRRRTGFGSGLKDSFGDGGFGGGFGEAGSGRSFGSTDSGTVGVRGDRGFSGFGIFSGGVENVLLRLIRGRGLGGLRKVETCVNFGDWLGNAHWPLAWMNGVG